MNMKWTINWIASVLAIYMLEYFYYSGELRLQCFGFWAVILIVVFGAGTASIGYGGALLLEKLVMKGNKFRNWVFMIISVPLSIGLYILIEEIL